jgi:DNA-binding IclR family transcriptional regulator
MNHKRFISINKIAALLGIHHATTRRYLESLKLETFVIGRRRLYRTEDVFSKVAALANVTLNR